MHACIAQNMHGFWDAQNINYNADFHVTCMS